MSVHPEGEFQCVVAEHSPWHEYKPQLERSSTYGLRLLPLDDCPI